MILLKFHVKVASVENTVMQKKEVKLQKQFVKLVVSVNIPKQIPLQPTAKFVTKTRIKMKSVSPVAPIVATTKWDTSLQVTL
jgi:hypothetical protein